VPRHQASGPWSIQVCPASTPTPPFCLLQFEIRQLRAHLAQQDLDLAAEREAALQVPHVLSQPRSRYKVVEARPWDEETAAESVVEELRPSQGESAGTRASPLQDCALSMMGAGEGHPQISALRSTFHSTGASISQAAVTQTKNNLHDLYLL
jgi:hypothetical protein